jgi:ribosomal protein S18 acetylase RimI-like enzyme
VHATAFPGFFLTRLGPAFLRTYYTNIVRDPEGVLLVVEKEGRVEGFVAGFANPAAFYGRMRSRRVRFGVSTLVGLVRSPALLGRVLANISSVRDRAASVRGPRSAELSSIAVTPALQGAGMGQALCRRFCTLMFDRGVDEVHLTTDADDNEAVNRLYRKMGFRLARTFEAPGQRRMHEYVRAREDDARSQGGEDD